MPITHKIHRNALGTLSWEQLTVPAGETWVIWGLTLYSGTSSGTNIALSSLGYNAETFVTIRFAANTDSFEYNFQGSSLRRYPLILPPGTVFYVVNHHGSTQYQYVLLYQVHTGTDGFSGNSYFQRWTSPTLGTYPTFVNLPMVSGKALMITHTALASAPASANNCPAVRFQLPGHGSRWFHYERMLKPSSDSTRNDFHTSTTYIIPADAITPQIYFAENPGNNTAVHTWWVNGHYLPGTHIKRYEMDAAVVGQRALPIPSGKAWAVQCVASETSSSFNPTNLRVKYSNSATTQLVIANQIQRGGINGTGNEGGRLMMCPHMLTIEMEPTMVTWTTGWFVYFYTESNNG